MDPIDVLWHTPHHQHLYLGVYYLTIAKNVNFTSDRIDGGKPRPLTVNHCQLTR